MTKIIEHTQQRLVVENKPLIIFGFVISLGAIAFFASLHSLLFEGKGLSKDTIFGLVLGFLFSVGGLFLYRETITIFDKITGKIIWKQRGLKVNKSDSAELRQIQDIVIGRPVGDGNSTTTAITIRLEDRSLPLMFGFSSVNNNKKIAEEIKSFIRDSWP